jgi:FkbM family methyltransferase
VYYLKKFIAHTRAGTLRKRCELALEQRREALLERWWAKQALKREYFDHEVESGVLLRLHFDSALARDIYCHNHERAERILLHRFLRPGDTFIDVGANIGLYSVLASRIVGPGGHVFSFEPDPRVYARLLFNLESNGCDNVKTFQLALSNADETRVMQISNAGFDAYNSFGAPVRGEGTFEAHDVTCMRYDSLAKIEPRMARASMIKIDVEGWEAMVLHGAIEQLCRENAPLLQLEFNDQAAKALGLSCKQIYQWLNTLHYSVYTFDHRSAELVPHPLKEHYVYDNVFATKDIASLQQRVRA